MKIQKLVTSNGNYYLSTPIVVNIQLSNYCPQKCPFCFMSFNENSEMEIKQLKKYLNELYDLGCRSITYGQCEPMVYSHIIEAVSIAKENGFRVNIVTSGAGCNYNKLRRLKELEVDEFHISLNSFDKSVNSKSRNGFEQAINTMKIANSIGISFKLNYVAQEDTIKGFEEYIEKADKMGAVGICVLREKVNNQGKSKGYTYDSLFQLGGVIQKSKIPIDIEECFCELMILMGKRERSDLQGCAAGRSMMAISADGKFLPCAHLFSKCEKFSTIKDYWNSSNYIRDIRNIQMIGEPCEKCIHISKCNPCQALYEDKREIVHANRQNCVIYTKATNE